MNCLLYQCYGVAWRTYSFGQLGLSLENLIFAQVIKTFWWCCCWLNYPFICCIRHNPSRYVPSTPATSVRLSCIYSLEIIPGIWQGSVLVRYSWLSLVDLSRQKNPEHLRVTLLLKPQRMVGREGVWEGIFGPLLPLNAATGSPACTRCSRWTMGVGVSPLSRSGRHPPL